MDINLLLLVSGYLASLFMAWCVGSNDASNPTDTAVGSGVLSLRSALILFSVFAGIGAILQGWMVMKTLGKGIVESIDIYGAVSAVVGAGIWILAASYKGMPISTSQSITGAVIGVGLSFVLYRGYPIYSIRWSTVLNIIASWITSPLISIFLAASLYTILSKYNVSRHSSGKVFSILLVSSLIFSAYSFGANDVGNATGVYYSITEKTLGLPPVQTRILLALLGSLGIALGGFTLGKRVIATVAYNVTRLEIVSGVAAELSNALTVWFFTTIPYMLFGYGLPISTTHASVSSIIGVGLAKNGIRGVNWRIVVSIILSWILTLPATILLGLTINYILVSTL